MKSGNIRVLVPARRAHAPIEHAVMSESGAERVRFGGKADFGPGPGLLINPTRPSAANLAVIESGHSQNDVPRTEGRT